eukprot:8734899-Pyramimonas_sp.AAC.1
MRRRASPGHAIPRTLQRLIQRRHHGSSPRSRRTSWQHGLPSRSRTRRATPCLEGPRAFAHEAFPTRRPFFL